MTGVVVLGCGLIGQKRIAALPDGCHAVGVYDPEVERAARLADAVPGCKVAASAEEALATPGVDLAIVATPHRMLAPLACSALDAGCHVLVEKPGAIDVVGSTRDRAACAGERSDRQRWVQPSLPSVVPGGETRHRERSLRTDHVHPRPLRARWPCWLRTRVACATATSPAAGSSSTRASISST